MRPLRIAYGRIAQETNAFSPVPSTFADFERLHYLEGDALAAACQPKGHEVPGMLRSGELSGFLAGARRAARGPLEALPLYSAWAMPSGPLTPETFECLRDRLVAKLQAAGPLDGLYLALHGAMRSTGPVVSPEVGLLDAARSVLGPEAPIAVTFDLHGHLTPAKVDPARVLVAYRTNPHRDLARSGRRAGELLVRTLQGEIHPVSRWRALPMVLGGGDTLDFMPPMRAVFRWMKARERDPGVLCLSLLMCHVWNDAPDLGWTLHVTTDGDPALADRLADELADRAWATRTAKHQRFMPPEEAIAKVRSAWLARRLGTVTLTDTSDVVGAGAPGENTHILRALLEKGQDLKAYVPLRDREAVLALWEHDPGAAVELTVGGHFAPEVSAPLELCGQLVSKHETRYFGRVAVLAVGKLRVVLTELAPYTLKPAFYADLGLDPWQADLVVVKSFFHFRIYFLAVNRKSLLVQTRGHTDMDLSARSGFDGPVHPWQPVDDWREADRRRRGVC